MDPPSPTNIMSIWRSSVWLFCCCYDLSKAVTTIRLLYDETNTLEVAHFRHASYSAKAYMIVLTNKVGWCKRNFHARFLVHNRINSEAWTMIRINEAVLFARKVLRIIFGAILIMNCMISLTMWTLFSALTFIGYAMPLWFEWRRFIEIWETSERADQVVKANQANQI